MIIIIDIIVVAIGIASIGVFVPCTFGGGGSTRNVIVVARGMIVVLLLLLLLLFLLLQSLICLIQLIIKWRSGRTIIAVIHIGVAVVTGGAIGATAASGATATSASMAPATSAGTCGTADGRWWCGRYYGRRRRRGSSSSGSSGGGGSRTSRRCGRFLAMKIGWIEKGEYFWFVGCHVCRSVDC